jgi:hypothetical protein
MLQLHYGLWHMNRTMYCNLKSSNARLKQFAVTHPLFELNVKDLEKLGLFMYKQMNTAFAA